jgi:hypothetical protein
MHNTVLSNVEDGKKVKLAEDRVKYLDLGLRMIVLGLYCQGNNVFFEYEVK